MARDQMWQSRVVSGGVPHGRPRTVVVDGNNVIGATVDGWWRDRPAAARRLLVRLQCYQRRTCNVIVLVLDVPQPDLPEGHHDGVAVRYPERAGRDAADHCILEFLDGHTEDPIEVVTSDRALADGAGRRLAGVIGAGAFLGRLHAAGC